jgi:hypothetical protein
MRTFQIRERDIEKYFAKSVESHGGVSFKWTSPSHRGVPDRIAIFPKGRVVFVEIKRANGKFSRLQEHVAKILKSLGCEYASVSSMEEVDEFFKERKI